MNASALNPERTYIHMRNDVKTTSRGLVTAIAAAAGSFLVLDLIAGVAGGDGGGRDGTFAAVLFIGGYVLTSLSFADLHDAKKGTHYLMLPGSLSEKFVARALLTTIGWIAVAIAFSTTTTLVSAGLRGLLLGRAGEIFLPISRGTWQAIGGYLVTQSLFLFGAVYFKKHALVKTVLALSIIAFAYGFYAVLMVRVVFWAEFSRFIPSTSELDRVFADTPMPVVEAFADVVEAAGRVLYWAVMPVFFWTLGYLRLKETEVGL